MAWPAWDFCFVVQQLARLFNFWHAWYVCNFLAACKLWATREIQSWVPASLYNLEYFFTLSHTLPLHNSHPNTGLLIAKIQANLARNKTNKMVDKIEPYSCIILILSYFKFWYQSKRTCLICVPGRDSQVYNIIRQKSYSSIGWHILGCLWHLGFKFPLPYCNYQPV